LTRSLRVLLIVLSHVAVLGIGGGLGFWLGFEAARDTRRFADEMETTEWFNAHLFAERLMGNAGSYRSTLLRYLDVLNTRRPSTGVVLNDHVTIVDVVLTEARLALLAESRGDAAEAQRYYAQAIAHCSKAWPDGCDEERLRKVIARLDKADLPKPSAEK